MGKRTINLDEQAFEFAITMKVLFGSKDESEAISVCLFDMIELIKKGSLVLKPSEKKDE